MNRKHFTCRRMFASGLMAGCLVLPGIVTQAEPNQADQADKVSQSWIKAGKMTTVSGELVDLHAYMTGQNAAYRDKSAGNFRSDQRDNRDRNQSTRSTNSNNPNNSEGRTTPDQRNDPDNADLNRRNGLSAARGAELEKDQPRIFAVKTSDGLIILGHDGDHPKVGDGVSRQNDRDDAAQRDANRSQRERIDLTPNANQRADRRFDDNRDDRDDNANNANKSDHSKMKAWNNGSGHHGAIGKKVKVTGQLFESGGISYLVCDRIQGEQTVDAAQDNDADSARGG